MSTIQLTSDQQAGFDRACKFIVDPNERVLVISGYSGTGKSTLMRDIVEEMPKIFATLEMVGATNCVESFALTATTNKAAENLESLTSHQAGTIQSLLGLTVESDFKANTTSLVVRDHVEKPKDTLIVVDEISFADYELLEYFVTRTINCKLIYVGDPLQLIPFTMKYAPAFNEGHPTIKLTEVVRQASDNPIIDVVTAFRETVLTGKWTPFTPDGHYVQWLAREDFDAELIDRVTDSGWKAPHTRVLSWTNKRAIQYNHAVSNHVGGKAHLDAGDYAINNTYISNKVCRLKTDQQVLITKATPSTSHNVDGISFEIDGRHKAFMPNDRDDQTRLIKSYRAQNNFTQAALIDANWIDLRAAYACTVNKSQGSTYGTVFIDLDDIRKCRNYNQLARMLYVATSRASDQVIMTGDII